MKAAVCERYGPPEVVQITDVSTPVPADDELLVKGLPQRSIPATPE